jgi:hypothetical protein
MYIAREQDCAGAGSEKSASVGGKLLQRVEESFFGHHFEVSGTLASRQNDAGKSGEVGRIANVRMRDAQALKNAGVRFVIALDCQDADFHLASIILHSLR